MGQEPNRLDYSDVRHHPDNQTIPGLLVVRPDAGILFANAASLKDEILRLLDGFDPPIQTVLLVLEMSFELDVPASDMLVEFHEGLLGNDVVLMLCRVYRDVMDILERSGAIDKIGLEKIFHCTQGGVLAYLTATRDWDETQAYIKESLSDLLHMIQMNKETAGDEQKDAIEIAEKLIQELVELADARIGP